MIRMFETHRVRPQEELTGLWRFTVLDGEKRGYGCQAAVPGCWEGIPGLERYRGRGEYETSIECSGNIRLVFKGVSHTASVLFDGVEVAGHYNAFTPFEAIIPGVKHGLHSLVVRVDNRFSEASALHIPNDYYTYGGIVRPVAWETVSDVYIDRVHATPCRKDGVWRLKLEVKVRNLGGQSVKVAPTVTAEGWSRTLDSRKVAAGGTELFTGEMSCPGAEEYSPESPRLYLLETRVSCEGQVCDDLIERIGFREVKVEGERILFNGKALRIKGFNRHEDHPQFGCALPLQAMYQDLSLLRDLGANSVRTSHYPNDELFLDLCDELGILVWEENHARGLEEAQMRNPNFRRQCEDCIREMIESHYNHPSIYIWGLLNECASETEYGRSCYAEQIAQIRSMDRSRPVSFASCKHFTDISLDLVDIVSYNIYPQWYVDEPVAEHVRNLRDWVQKAGGAGKPFLITEIGAGGIYGYRNPNQVKWTEDRQELILREQVSSVLADEAVSGLYVWQFCDVRVTEEEWGMRRPRTMNNKGIVDEYRRPKLAYGAVRQIYGTHGNYR